LNSQNIYPAEKKNKNKKMLIGFDIGNVESSVDLEEKQVRFNKL
jgi:hypothetical protein